MLRPRPPSIPPPRRRSRGAVPRLVLFLLLALAALHAGSARGARLDRGVVAAPESVAAEVGAQVLRDGGNAVDAAVAVQFALAVTYPRAGNLGGGGFMLVHTDSGDVAIDYRETAPAGASRDMYLDSSGRVVEGLSLETHRAAGVPGTVAGMWMAHRRWGRLSWARLVEPAAGIAARGWRIDARTAAQFEERKSRPGFSACYHGRAGELLVQRDLAATLRRIAAQGPDGFYRGRTARLLVEEMRRGGGLVTAADLAAYRPAVRAPVSGTYRGLRVVAMSPPSSGGIGLLQLLHLVEPRDPARLAAGGTALAHLYAEAEKRVFADRARWLGDPDFVSVPAESLISAAYAARRGADIALERRTAPEAVRAGAPAESEQTTHFSIVDRDGNAVANTTTLNDSYGSGIVVRGAGFLLNNEMDDFSARPGTPNLYGVTGGEANAIAPGKRMLSSMCPTFVYRDGSPWLILGSPGGPTIFTTVFQVIVNRVDLGMSLDEAVAAPRIHHQWPPRAAGVDAIDVEAGRPVAAATAAGLEALGYVLRARGPLGDVQAIEVAGGRAVGASDPRGTGHVAVE